MSQPERAVLPLSESGEFHRLGGTVFQISTPGPCALSHPGAQHSTLGQGSVTVEVLNMRACCSAGDERVHCSGLCCISKPKV